MSRLRKLFRRQGRDDAIDFCRGVDWRGFEHLHAAEAEGRGVLFVILADGEPVLARDALQRFLMPPPKGVAPGNLGALEPKTNTRWVVEIEGDANSLEHLVAMPIICVLAERQSGRVVVALQLSEGARPQSAPTQAPRARPA